MAETETNSAGSQIAGNYPDDLEQRFYGDLESRAELREHYDVDETTLDEWIDELDEDVAKRRAQEIRSHHRDMSEKRSKAVAWKELGYTDTVIARKVDSTKSTVTSYLDDVAETYGRQAVMVNGGPRDGALDRTTSDTKLNFGGSK